MIDDQCLTILEYKNVPAFLNDSLPEIINEHDIYLFLDARKNSTKLITEVCLIHCDRLTFIVLLWF